MENLDPFSPSSVPWLSVLQTLVYVSGCVFTCGLLSKQTSLSFVLISQTSFSCWWLRMSASCPSEPAIQFQGKFSLGENKDSSTRFFFEFLITSLSVSEAFFFKKNFTMQVLPHGLSLIITFLIICSH